MTDKTKGANRRDFLRLAGTAAPAAAIAVASTPTAGEVDLQSERMQDTEHTRAYLDSARF